MRWNSFLGDKNSLSDMQKNSSKLSESLCMDINIWLKLKFWRSVFDEEKIVEMGLTICNINITWH